MPAIVGVWIEPVTAQVIITFLLACATLRASSRYACLGNGDE
jgi:hypothetical protein